MKILMLFPYAPLPPPLDLAGTKRNLPFILELTKYNDVSVLSFGNSEEKELFQKSYGELFKEIRFIDAKRPRIINGLERIWLLGTGRSSFRQYYKPIMQQAIDEMTSATKYDIIHCCVPFFGYYRFPKDVPVSSDTHEVKSDLFRRTAQNTKNLFWKTIYYLSYKFGKKEEFALCNKFDLLIATTPVDKQVFRTNLPDQNIIDIQNGAGKTFFEDLDIKPEPNTMVFTGLFTHLPNSQGIIYFLDKIFPLILKEVPEARVYVVGKDPTREMQARASENIIITGFVDDVRPYMAKAQVFIIPLQAGGGIRGKALEAMAMKRPIVTTTIGVEGINLIDEKSALFADTPEKFTKAVVRLFNDNNLCETLANNAYFTAVNQYTWEAKGKELADALHSLALEHSSKKESKIIH